jgi:nucleoid-associated protein YgaU
LPAFYTVRLIESARDCFWRIAEYPFIYGDPWKWKILYEANKDKLPVPENPDLILPGIVLSIPSIAGETRSGHWSE